MNAQEGAGPHWFSILEKHSTKICMLTRNICTYVCLPSAFYREGRKQLWNNTLAEVKTLGRGENNYSLMDKWRLAPRFSSAPTTASQMLSSQGERAWDTWQRSSDFSYVISPLFPAAFAAQGQQGSQLSWLGGWNQLHTCQHATHLLIRKLVSSGKTRKPVPGTKF